MYWFLSKQKWGDKKEALLAKEANKLADYRHKVEILIAEMKKVSAVDKEKNKTELEKIKKEWQVKYIEDIEELKKLFKDAEKRIKEKSVSASRRSLVGKFIERFVPFLSNVKYAAADMHFMGSPIDYIVFDGLRDDEIKKIIFLEVKTGESKLTKREKSLKDAVNKRKVKWEEVRVGTSEQKTPDKKMTEKESMVDDLYGIIDNKIKTVRKSAGAAFDAKEGKTTKTGAIKVVCPECEGVCELDDDEIEDYKNYQRFDVECPHCEQTVSCSKDDLAN